MARSEKHEAHAGSYHMNLRGGACALAGGALWGFSGTAVSYLFRSSGIDPMWVMSVRMVLAGILFLLFSVARGDRRPFELLRGKSAVRDLLLFAGAGLFLSQFSYLMAIQATNSATATVLQSLQLLPVAAVACVIGRRAPKRREVIGMVLALAGTFLITTGGDPSQMALPPAGLAFGLLAALGGPSPRSTSRAGRCSPHSWCSVPGVPTSSTCRVCTRSARSRRPCSLRSSPSLLRC